VIVEGKAAIVTGAGTGVGRATALRLAELGCSVLINYSRSRDAAEGAAAEVERGGVKGARWS
jgi:3-oxoacyl-[acyl-carrier protein] reductase